MTMSHFDGIQCFCQWTDLVYFDQDRVGTTFFDTHSQEVYIGYEQVVTYQLAAVADTFGQFFPTFPVIFAHTVFDRIDRVFVDQFLQIVYLFVGCTFFTFVPFELGIIVDAVVVEFGRSTVHGNHYIFTRFVSGSFDGGNDRIQCIFGTFEVGSETAFITYGSTKSAIF